MFDEQLALQSLRAAVQTCVLLECPQVTYDSLREPEMVSLGQLSAKAGPSNRQLL